MTELYTNEEGVIRIEGLPYGQYLVVETTIPKDVFQCDPFIVTVSKDSPQSRFTVPAGSVTTATNNYMAYNVLDEELEGYLQLVKTDTETGKAVKIANTAFALYKLDDKGNKTRISMIDPASGNATKKTDVFYTDADGLMKTPEKLPLGRYFIEELQGPEGYYNDSAYSVEFEITSERVWQVVGNATNDMDEYIVEEKYFNHETLGQLTIRKLGNVLTDYKDGQFIYTQDNLAGATYEIYADDDIATLDRQGTYWYKDGDLVATVTTGAAGQVDEVKFAPNRTQATYDFLTISHDGTKGEVTVTLPLGKYTITEVNAPYGFVLTQQSYTQRQAAEGDAAHLQQAVLPDICPAEHTEYGFCFRLPCRNLLFDNKNTAVSGDTAGVTNMRCPAPYALDGSVCLVVTFAATNHRPSSNHNSRSLP